MNPSRVLNVVQWVLAPIAAVAIAYQLSDTQTPQQPVDARSASADEPIGTPESMPSPWQRARQLADPLRRIQASWAALEETDLQGQQELFRQALEDEDHEGLVMLGETGIARDPIRFIETFSDIAIRVSSPPAFQTQMDRAFRIWMKADPEKALQAFLKLDQQSQLILGSSSSPSLAGDLLLAHLSKDPAAVVDIDLKAFASGVGNHLTNARFAGDVEALAHGLSQRSLDDGQTERLLEFFQRAILTNDRTEETNQRYLAWWRALPEAMQLESIPWDASPEILDHPGLQKHLAQRATEELSQVPVYMAHYGQAWAAENPQEVLEWVLGRYENEALTGPPFRLTPNRSGTGRMGVNLTDRLGHDSESFFNAVSIPIRALAANDPRQAVEAMENLPYPHTRSKIALVIAREWTKSNPDAALKWSETLPGRYARDQARALIVGRPQGSGFGFGPIEISP